MSSVRQFIDRAPSLRILVAGDAMLDTYVSGEATRISPEAPVPVVAVSSRRSVPGGAANVAANVRALGAAAMLAGVIGFDPAADILAAHLETGGIDASAVVRDSMRVTTSKTRITAGGQQIVRFDEEHTTPLSPAAESELRRAILALLPTVDACIVSDYAKGVVSTGFSRWVISEAARLSKPVVVDPKSRDLARYSGATVITPNLKEAALAAGEPQHAEAAHIDALAAHLIPLVHPSSLLVTMGGDGMALFEPGTAPLHLHAMPVEVADVTGAGDTVVAVLAIALGMGMPLREAAALANTAAGLAVRHTGTWAVTGAELLSHHSR